MLRHVLLAGLFVTFALLAISASVYLGVDGLHETTKRGSRSSRRLKAPKDNPPAPFHVPIIGANQYRYFSTSASDRVSALLRRRRKALKEK